MSDHAAKGEEKAQAMAKNQNLVTKATDAALQWHFGVITEPPSSHAGKEYLTRHLPKQYQLEGDTLVHCFPFRIKDLILSSF